MSVYSKHAKVVLLHKYYVMKECFKAGLYWQGIVHDMSKFGVAEFCASARYFQGASVDSEKKKVEYSHSWLHHKSHNKHHWQYWMDFDKGCLVLERMPPKYLAEMLCDWVGAGKSYNAGAWTPETFVMWAKANVKYMHLHSDVSDYISEMLESVEECKSEQSIRDYINVGKIERYYSQLYAKKYSYKEGGDIA